MVHILNKRVSPQGVLKGDVSSRMAKSKEGSSRGMHRQLLAYGVGRGGGGR